MYLFLIHICLYLYMYVYNIFPERDEFLNLFYEEFVDKVWN